MRIALAQMNVVAGRPDINSSVILKMIKEANNNADLIIFPGLCLTGSFFGCLNKQNAFLLDCEYYAQKIIKASNNIAVIFGSIATDDATNEIFIAAYNGELIDKQPVLTFSAKSPNKPFALNFSGNIVRLLITDITSSVEFDFSQPDISADYDLLINMSSVPFAINRNKKRHDILSYHARNTAKPVIAVNNIGIQNTGKVVYIYDGCSTAYNKDGNPAAYCEPFLNGIEYFDTDTHDICNRPFKNETESVFNALSYGIKQFLQMIQMKKVVIGASGGIDSAVAAALYTHVLGAENVLIANMPGQHTSSTTQCLAAQLASNLGCPYMVVPINESVDSTIRQVSSTPVQRPDGSTFYLEITPFMIENVQARDRSARILSILSAFFGGGFTCNANKSETTIGYSTLYGDQAGFLAALADLWKYRIYEMADYINLTVFKREIIPQKTIDIKPSAELSPAQAVDEGKGDPLTYPYHDHLFRALMESSSTITPEDILFWYSNDTLEVNIGCQPGLVNQIFPDVQHFIDDLERWYKLFTGMGVAKRIQSPPILAVTDYPYGFKTESQGITYFTRRYHQLKSILLEEKNV